MFALYNHEQNKDNKEEFPVVNWFFFPPNKVDFPTTTVIIECDTFCLHN